MLPNLLLLLVVSLAPFFAAPQPQFKGGARGLNSFITSNLIYPEYSKQNCLQGTVNISFKLNRQGRIVSSQVVKGYGTDLDLEALRIIRLSSGRWVVPSDYDTTVALVLPVNFSLKDYKCEEKSRDELSAAMAAYHARQDLNKAIFNYYSKLDQKQGTGDAAEKVRIEALKSQLGYDEKYINRLLKQAQRKLKQGDRESACEDFQLVRLLGSDKANSLIGQNCK